MKIKELNPYFQSLTWPALAFRTVEKYGIASFPVRWCYWVQYICNIWFITKLNTCLKICNDIVWNNLSNMRFVIYANVYLMNWPNIKVLSSRMFCWLDGYLVHPLHRCYNLNMQYEVNNHLILKGTKFYIYVYI